MHSVSFGQVPLLCRLPLALGAAACLAQASPAAASSEDTWARASDVGVATLLGWSIGLPLAEGDGRGALQAAGSTASAGTIALGLKEIFPETRPNGQNRKSFPSSHTSVAFGAAASILMRRGAGEGVPALAVASLVGLARVEAKKHHWYDVAVGAAIGSGCGLLITSKQDRAAAVAWGDTHSIGVTYSTRF
jgi:hypothetical protein